MKYLYSWLKEYYPEIPLLEKLDEHLVQFGHDVESITPVTFPGVHVAEITAIAEHPNADKLRLVTIQTKEGAQTVVCGAPHLTVGQKVAYAELGATLPSGLTIRAAKIRGIASAGMLCAEDELGLGPNHAELLPVPPEATIGDAITAYVPDDAIITLDVTPNRGDVLSHFGLARDLQAAISGQTLSVTPPELAYAGKSSETIAIGALPDDVPAISFGLATTEDPLPDTPLFIQSRLNRLGHKSINLPTDITNYLLLAYGQPLHAFALESLAKPVTFGARKAEDGEKLEGLNGSQYSLTNDQLVITNQNQPLSIAGVLGGEATKITPESRQIVFECASFNPKTIAQSMRSLRLQTESAVRFARGVDPDLRPVVLRLAQSLWQQWTGGAIYEPIEKITGTPPARTTTTFSLTQLNTFLGASLDSKTVTDLLTALGCMIQASEETITVSPPSWRFDLALFEDYAEEIVRSLGLDSLAKKALPANVPQGKRAKYWRTEQLKDMLAATGGYEIKTYPFISEEEKSLWQFDDSLSKLQVAPIENKLLLRPSLKPGLLGAVSTNPETPQLIFFEIGKVFGADREMEMVGIAAAANNSGENDSFWRNLFERLKLPVSSWMARIVTIDEALRQAYKIRKSAVTLLELPLEELISLKMFESPVVKIPDIDAIHYVPLARYQASRRDIAFIIPDTFAAPEITKDLKQLHPTIVDVELFDTYKSPSLGPNNYSLAYHLYYQAPDHTLTTEEIQSTHQLVEHHIKEHYHGTIR